MPALIFLCPGARAVASKGRPVLDPVRTSRELHRVGHDSEKGDQKLQPIPPAEIVPFARAEFRCGEKWRSTIAFGFALEAFHV